MASEEPAAPVNTLGLELEQPAAPDIQPEPTPANDDPVPTPTATETKDSAKEKKGKDKPYHNPDRVLTGGSQRVRTTFAIAFFDRSHMSSRTNSRRMS